MGLWVCFGDAKVVLKINLTNFLREKMRFILGLQKENNGRMVCNMLIVSCLNKVSRRIKM